MIGTDPHGKDCSWSDAEDRLGEGGSVGVSEGSDGAKVKVKRLIKRLLQ